MSASPLIGHAGLAKPRDDSDTVITSLIPGGSIPRHQSGQEREAEYFYGHHHELERQLSREEER